MTQGIKVLAGIRQGDSLSPCLFNIIMNQIIRGVNKIEAGYTMRERSLIILCYTDDVILIAENEDDLQRLLNRFKTTAERFNMFISHKKTKAMVIAKDPTKCKLMVDDQIIEQIMSFLGMETSSEETKRQANKTARIAGCLRDIIWRNKYMSAKSKIQIYEACIRSVLTYAAETRAETSQTKRVKRTMKMRILRTIKSVKLRDRMRSDTIQKELEVQDVVRWTRIRRRF